MTRRVRDLGRARRRTTAGRGAARTGAAPTPPQAFLDFTRRFPGLAEAWGRVGQAGREGPLEPATQLLVKLAVAAGAGREGAVHSAVRKALAAGVPPAALEQVLALGAGTLGFPATVAAWCWVRDEVRGRGARRAGHAPRRSPRAR